MLKTDTTKKIRLNTDRLRWSAEGKKSGPVVILFVGIHGNEPAGLAAVDLIAENLNRSPRELSGSVYAITGNLGAIKQGVRYIDADLNRIWEMYNTRKDFSRINGITQPAEYSESLGIKQTIEQILAKHKNDTSEFIFADLHTTSSQSCAFILLNDTLANRSLARKFSVPQILGIEENIHGTLLSYVNNLGYKALGFEAGAHHDRESVKRSEAFLWLLMHNAGVLELNAEEFSKFKKRIRAHAGVPDTYYEILYHKLVEDPEKFEMMSGFENFDRIEKDTPLAYEEGRLIKAPKSGRIFMPLYQKKGHDGFLIVNEVSEFWLELSAYFRNSFVHALLKYLPGVSVGSKQSFEVDLRIARFLVKDIFHLLGYRVTEKDEYTLICYKR
ncbi:MAG: aspartoacylase [Balneolaceae bacterium]|nr:MAG: aspartoacylase [Balneolaceae bacterium]